MYVEMGELHDDIQHPLKCRTKEEKEEEEEEEKGEMTAHTQGAPPLTSSR
jgi:CO dehydrogenase/acetyl-CoA synthase beta subunit